MNQSKRKLKPIQNKSKISNKTKNRPTSRSCEDFCKNDYMVEMKKVFKQVSEKYKIPYKSPTKEDDAFAYKTCKKTFCNEKCEGFGDKEKEKEFKKKIKNGFQKTYSAKRIGMLKKRGALSGCVDVTDYDVFHK